MAEMDDAAEIMRERSETKSRLLQLLAELHSDGTHRSRKSFVTRVCAIKTPFC